MKNPDKGVSFLNVNGSQAIIPKARGIFSKHLSDAEYEELMRKRSVTEIAALMKSHPYYKDSLASLSITDPHRGQIEELLNMDIFVKYEKLARYCKPGDEFAAYYLRRSEMNEILKALHLVSIGYPGGFASQMSVYLKGKVSFDIFSLSSAKNFAQITEVLRGTPYFKVLRNQMAADPRLRNFPATEAAVIKSSYADLFAVIDKSFKGREREEIRNLFLLEAEIYNLELILRIKSYFPKAYSPQQIKDLTLPYIYKINKSKLDQLVNARDVNALTNLYKTLGIERFMGLVDIEELNVTGDKILYEHGARMLHMTTSPSAAMAAFIMLAKLEKDNVISVIEGVRYKMPPERIRLLLRHI